MLFRNPKDCIFTQSSEKGHKTLNKEDTNQGKNPTKQTQTNQNEKPPPKKTIPTPTKSYFSVLAN